MAETDIPISVNTSAESCVIQVSAEFESQHETRQLSKRVCIFRVPKVMMVCKPEAYEPMLVSLGPYHHIMNPKPSTMDEHKVEAVHRTLRRIDDMTIPGLISEIQRSESEIRECYEEAIEWNGEILSWMLAKDACFILEFLRLFISVNSGRESGMESGIEWFSLLEHGRVNYLIPGILDDILKLENQIPLCILIKILQLEYRTPEAAVSNLAQILKAVKDLQGYPFSSQLSDDGQIEQRVREHVEKGACHLLDLCRRITKDLLTHSGSESGNARADIVNGSESYDDSRSTPTAELLENAGIKFQSGQIGFGKRRFRSSILCLPQISVDDSTETRLRNLMAYEECQRCSWSPEETVISNYICILCDLIASEKDVYILRRAKVIRSAVGGSKYITDFFNHIDKGITIEPVKQFEVVMKQAREHYSSTWNLWVNEFKEEYCSKPWYVVSLLVAMLILVMTAVQTVYSVKK